MKACVIGGNNHLGQSQGGYEMCNKYSSVDLSLAASLAALAKL